MGKLFAYAFATVRDNLTPVCVRIMMDGTVINAVGHDVADIDVTAVIRTNTCVQRTAKRPGNGGSVRYTNAGLDPRTKLVANLPIVGSGVYANVSEMVLLHGTKRTEKSTGYLSSITAHERLALVKAIKANYEA